jgi:hypothetical protein
MTTNIELELRAEISPTQLKTIISKLKNKYLLISKNKRLSVMFLGKTNNLEFDIRVRINNKSKAELVIKRGAFHAHNRIEISQEINKDEFLGLVKIFSVFGFKSKITERENLIFDLGDNIELTLVKAGKIAYVEIEKMSNNKNVQENKEKLLKILSEMNLKLIKNKNEFNELCDRLSVKSDTQFNGSTKDYKKLEKLFSAY